MMQPLTHNPYMDDWVDGLMCGWMDRWIDRWMHGSLNNPRLKNDCKHTAIVKNKPSQSPLDVTDLDQMSRVCTC